MELQPVVNVAPTKVRFQTASTGGVDGWRTSPSRKRGSDVPYPRRAIPARQCGPMDAQSGRAWRL